jgi:hypothetical protein
MLSWLEKSGSSGEEKVQIVKTSCHCEKALQNDNIKTIAKEKEV